ncbi:MAG: sugar phosphate nucleotidyltransferase [Methanocellales archaeon]
MKAVILAAGEGTRCRPLTLLRSKVMLPIANKPILEHVIQALIECGIKDIVMVVGYKKERIMDYFEDGKRWDVNIEYVVQPQQLGTAHAIKHAENKVEGQFLVLNGDNLIEARAIKDLLSSADGDISILAVVRENVADYGVLIVDEKKVIKIIEKPKTSVSRYVNTGVYLLNEEIFKGIEKTKASEDGEFGITSTIAQMIESRYKVSYVKTNALWLDVVYPWDLIDVNAMILQGRSRKRISEKARIEEKVVIAGEVEIGENTVIYSNSCIIGPTVIGDNCEIGPSAVIQSCSSIGNNVTIKPFSQIENSIIMNGVEIGSHASIINSIIGENTVIRAHFSTEYGKNVKVEIGEGLRYFKDIGAIVGENCDLGTNILIKAGKILGVNCRVDSGKIISSNIESNSIVM